MLRRPATTIQLTQADVEQFEANRQRKLWERQQAQQQTSSHIAEANDTNKQLAPSSASKSKKDRIMGGTGRGN